MDPGLVAKPTQMHMKSCKVLNMTVKQVKKGRIMSKVQGKNSCKNK